MLIDKIRDDLKTAMKAREAARVGALRFLLSELKNVGINEKRELDDRLVIGVLKKLVKQRRDAIDQFGAAGRNDLVAKEEAELGVLQGYLPPPLADGDLEAQLRALLQELGTTSKKDMGKVMKSAVERFGGVADGKRIQALVSKLLP